MQTSDYIKLGVGAGVILGGLYLYNKYFGSNANPNSSLGTDIGTGVVSTGRDVILGGTKEISETLFGKDNRQYPRPTVSPVTEYYDESGNEVIPKTQIVNRKAQDFIKQMTPPKKQTYQDVATKVPNFLDSMKPKSSGSTFSNYGQSTVKAVFKPTVTAVLPTSTAKPVLSLKGTTNLFPQSKK